MHSVRFLLRTNLLRGNMNNVTEKYKQTCYLFCYGKINSRMGHKQVFDLVGENNENK